MIRFPIRNKPRKIKGAIIGMGSGPPERILYLKRVVTKLFRDERIEGRGDRVDEARGYAEQLINLAIQNGDRHEPTMRMADSWLLEKDLVHKLFKVFVPRYQQYSTSFTSVYRLPATYPGSGGFNAVLELKGNPYPPIIPRQRETRHLLSNVLISAANKDYHNEQNRAHTRADTLTNSVQGDSINQVEEKEQNSNLEENLSAVKSSESVDKSKDSASVKGPTT